MQVTMEQLDPCKVLLNIEVEAEEVERAIERVYREFNRSMEIPGFRKGKVPRPILERHVRPDSVYRHAVDYLVPPAYTKALEETGVEPYDHPQFELVSLERNKPFAFKATVPLPPKIELGEYKGIKATRRSLPIKEEDVENEVRRLQDRHAKLEPVEGRGVEMDDLVLAEIDSTAEEGQTQEKGRVSMVQIGQNAPEFDRALLGAMPGEEREAVIPSEEGEKEEQIGPINMKIKIREIRRKILPEVNDEFAKNTIGEETLDDLKAKIRADLDKQAEQILRMDVENKLVDEILSRSTIHFPDTMVEQDVEEDIRQLQEELDRRGLTREQYLQGVDKTEAALREEMAERARNRIRAGLVLGEVARKEGITLSPEEVDAEIEKMAAENQVPKATLVQYLEAQRGMDSVKNRVMKEKILTFLAASAEIEQEEQSG